MFIVTTYIELMRDYPILSAAAQFMLLGVVGECLASKVRGGKFQPFGFFQLLFKIVVWGGLGVLIKYAFTGFFGFYDALVHKNLWPATVSFMDAPGWKALSVSVFTNLLFGPVMIGLHRIMDNLIEHKKMNWDSLVKAWLTLIYFWIPAHAVTFSLPEHFRIGLAALWAIVLGVILGFFSRGK